MFKRKIFESNIFWNAEHNLRGKGLKKINLIDYWKIWNSLMKKNHSDNIRISFEFLKKKILCGYRLALI